MRVKNGFKNKFNICEFNKIVYILENLPFSVIANESSESCFSISFTLAQKAFVAASNKTPNSSREIFNGNDWEARRQFTAWKLLKIPYVIPPIIWD